MNDQSGDPTAAISASNRALTYLFLRVARHRSESKRVSYWSHLTTISGGMLFSAGPYVCADLARAKARQWAAVYAPTALLFS